MCRSGWVSGVDFKKDPERSPNGTAVTAQMVTEAMVGVGDTESKKDKALSLF